MMMEFLIDACWAIVAIILVAAVVVWFGPLDREFSLTDLRLQPAHIRSGSVSRRVFAWGAACVPAVIAIIFVLTGVELSPDAQISIGGKVIDVASYPVHRDSVSASPSDTIVDWSGDGSPEVRPGDVAPIDHSPDNTGSSPGRDSIRSHVIRPPWQGHRLDAMIDSLPRDLRPRTASERRLLQREGVAWFTEHIAFIRYEELRDSGH
jgi:hypothetical protein